MRPQWTELMTFTLEHLWQNSLNAYTFHASSSDGGTCRWRRTRYLGIATKPRQQRGGNCGQGGTTKLLSLRFHGVRPCAFPAVLHQGELVSIGHAHRVWAVHIRTHAKYPDLQCLQSAAYIRSSYRIRSLAQQSRGSGVPWRLCFILRCTCITYMSMQRISILAGKRYISQCYLEMGQTPSIYSYTP